MNFLKNNKRFSFNYNGKSIWEMPYKTELEETENTLTTVYYFNDGLKVTNIAKKYENYDAYEWVNYFENTSDKNTGIISNLWDCDATFPIKHQNPFKWEACFPERTTSTKVYAPSGSSCKMAEFFTRCDSYRVTDHLQSGGPSAFFNPIRKYKASGGRSSADNNAPFFNVHKEGEGYIFAIGWTGQWNSEILRSEDTVTFKSKIEDTNFYLMPGEKFRTSSVVIMKYTGDVICSQNKWRRLVKNHFSLIDSEGRDKYAPLCASVWGGLTSDAVIERVNTIKENNIPFEYIWMDAGWYGMDTKPTPDEFKGDWSEKTGDYIVSPLIHPNGLKDVSNAIHDAGMKFLLWFEPERAVATSSVVSEHPEYFLSKKEDNSSDLLLNLGNPEAFSYCFEMLSNHIKNLNIDCYRQDFNFSPLEYWQKGDTPDRVGITEIKHINGLYKLWDMLLQKFPGLIIDNCSSGGRRIDIETLKRSVPLWRSDYQCVSNFDIESAQLQTMTYGTWMPYSGTCPGRVYDEYRVRSAYSPALNLGYLYSENEKNFDLKENIDFIKKYSNEFLKVRPYLSEDFYPLTGFSYDLDVWCGMQFNRPSLNDGLIMLFRRENSPYETSCFVLRGLNENKNYIFTDENGVKFTKNGKELLNDGLKITMPEKRSSKLYFYKEI